MFSQLVSIYNSTFTLFFIIINLIILLKFAKKIIGMICGDAKRTSNYVLITGCDSGFGYMTALALSKRNLYVFASCLTNEGVTKLNDDECFTGLAFNMDITNMEDIQNAKNMIDEKVGDEGLWSVINNAGICQPGPIEWVPTDNMKTFMEVNTWGTVNVTKIMLPLVKRCNGRIIIMSSCHARVCMEYFVPYSMSKAATGQFAEGLRYEMAPWDVSVHIIESGGCNTGLMAAFGKRMYELWHRQPKDVQEQYGNDFVLDVLKARFQAIFPWLGHPRHVVNAYVHAVLSSRPELLYIVGLDANTAYRVMAALPTDIGDFVKSLIVSPVLPVVKQKGRLTK